MGPTVALLVVALLAGCSGNPSGSGSGAAPKPSDARAIANGITSSPQPARVGGLSQMREAPFGTSIWRVNDQWYGSVGGAWLQVYAGGPTTPDGAAVAYGAVRVLSLPLDPNAADQTVTDVGDFAPTPHTGALTISAVNGDVLTLRDPSGRIVRFDVATDSFTI